MAEAALPLAIVGSSLIGADASSNSAGSAERAQAQAASDANATQLAMFNKTQANLQPYMDSGNVGNSQLANRLTDLTSPIKMDQTALQNTPGYQFNLANGLRAVQNGAAARGLGSSGAALKGAATYATGLADSTYQNQFNNAVTNQSNAYNRLLGVASLGENAAAGLGNNAVATGTNIGNNIIGAGNNAAANSIAQGNALSNAANSVPNSLITQQILQSRNGGQFAGGASGWTNPDTGYYNP